MTYMQGSLGYYMAAGGVAVTPMVQNSPMLFWDASCGSYVLAHQVQYIPVKYPQPRVPARAPRPLRPVQTSRLAKLPVQVNYNSTKDRSQGIDMCVNAFVKKNFRPGEITSALVRSTRNGAWHSGASDSRWHITVDLQKNGRHIKTVHVVPLDAQWYVASVLLILIVFVDVNAKYLELFSMVDSP